MDEFTYNYLDINGENSNRLDYVADGVTSSTYENDIKHGQNPSNYKYNKLGELIEDVQENMILHWRFGDHKLKNRTQR